MKLKTMKNVKMKMKVKRLLLFFVFLKRKTREEMVYARRDNSGSKSGNSVETNETLRCTPNYSNIPTW
jgi:hypothetical protein